MALLAVRIGRFVALCRTYHQHVALGSLSLRLDGHAPGRSQHAFASLGSAETGIHHHRHILGAQGMELVVELAYAVARGHDAALAVYGQQIGSAVAFIRHAMSGIIEDKPGLITIGLGDVLHPADFCQDIVERGILAHVHVLLRDAQRLGAILAESHSVVEGEFHVHLLLVVLVGDNHRKGLLLLRLRNGDVDIHIRSQIACQCLEMIGFPGSVHAASVLVHYFLRAGRIGSHHHHAPLLAHRNSLGFGRLRRHAEQGDKTCEI